MRRNSLDCFVGVHRLSAAFQIRRTVRRPRVTNRPAPLRLPRSSSCGQVRHPSLRLSFLFIHHKLRVNVLGRSRAGLLPFLASDRPWLFVGIVCIERRRGCYEFDLEVRQRVPLGWAIPRSECSPASSACFKLLLLRDLVLATLFEEVAIVEVAILVDPPERS